MQLNHNTKLIAVLVGIFASVICLLVAAGISYAHESDEANDRIVVAHYHKDVDCTITSIDARWCVYYWKVDVEYENAEYGLSGHQTLTMKDGADFKDARVGDHVAAVLLSDLDNETKEVLNRKLGNIVISAGYDSEKVRLR